MLQSRGRPEGVFLKAGSSCATANRASHEQGRFAAHASGNHYKKGNGHAPAKTRTVSNGASGIFREAPFSVPIRTGVETELTDLCEAQEEFIPISI